MEIAGSCGMAETFSSAADLSLLYVSTSQSQVCVTRCPQRLAFMGTVVSRAERLPLKTVFMSVLVSFPHCDKMPDATKSTRFLFQFMVSEASICSDLSPPLRACVEAECHSNGCLVKQSFSPHGGQKPQRECEMYPSEAAAVPSTSSMQTPLLNSSVRNQLITALIH